jgi:quercetin dioxygenase-like cupin family protein
MDEEAGGSGIHYDVARQVVVVDGVVVRDLATFPLGARPHRAGRAAALDFLAGNSTLGLHLADLPAGGEAEGHRHLEETSMFVVAGRGWTELRQSDDIEPQRVTWRAGDLLAIPANVWHRHGVDPAAGPARQLAFKSSRLLRKLFHDRGFLVDNDFRFRLRFDDQPDFWAVRRPANHGRLRIHLLRAAADEVLEPWPEAGHGVSLLRTNMAGHRVVEASVVGIEAGGRFRLHRPLAEEALLVLSGAGRTTLRAEDGREASVDWRQGDLIVPPLGVARGHEPAGDAPVRLMRVQSTFIERALGVKGDLSLDGVLPDRFPAVLEADRAALDEALARADADAAAAPPILGDET